MNHASVQSEPQVQVQPAQVHRMPWRSTLALVLGVLALKLIYLAWLCPYPLIEDEAHYWEWSRRLDWSYYSKGPGVAWAIWLSTHTLGLSEFSVRAPAAISAALGALCVAGLVRDATRSARAGVYAAACFILCPAFVVTSLLMTIDMPYSACWAAAAWAGYRALCMNDRPAWVWMGAAIGLGVIFKYTMLLFVPGLVLAAFLTPRAARSAKGAIRVGSQADAAARTTTVATLASQTHPQPLLSGERRAFRTPYIVMGTLVALLGLLPIVIWNAQNGWPTVHHLLGHLGVKGGDMPVVQGDAKGWHYSPLWTLEFVGLQVLMLGPALALVIDAWRRRDADGTRLTRVQPGRMYMLAIALPLMVFYIGVTFIAEAEANWAVASFVTLCGLAGWGASDAMDELGRRRAAWLALPAAQRPKAGIFRRSPESAGQIAWHWTIGVGVAVMLVIALLYPISRLPLIGPKVPMTRISGAREMAADAQARLAELRAQGNDPFVMTQLYGTASQLAFYLPGHPVVYSASSQTGGRKTQYDMWRRSDPLNTNINDPSLHGRAALLVGATLGQWQAAFERVEPAPKLSGDRKRGREVFVGYGYRGFAAGATP
ncbi:MAG: glycosyltransferase family 39 protein [Planctomycetota bacterium]|nr:glycosyltransferase family 39 protein [Planctomycetota bacterium]